jgi:hypothetical protein
MDQIVEWFSDSSHGISILAGIAALTWVVTLFLVPWFVARLPVDFFNRQHRRPVYADSLHPAVGWCLATLKNTLGAVLILLGLVMLVMPGQGLATVLVGVMLLNFPGKYKLEQRIAQRANILKSLNWLRAKFNKPPLEAPPATHDA